MNRQGTRLCALAASVALIVGTAGPASAAATPTDTVAAPADSLALEVLSGRADSVTGGDALVAVTGASDDAKVTAAGVDVTELFAPIQGDLVALVDGLPLGVSELVVTDNGDTATLEVENHPITGPVFSGEQHPMYCTAAGSPWNLGAVDEDCHVAEAVVTYRYRATSGQFQDYPTDGSTPTDVATATTADGVSVPYIVRIERGTINRAVYETAVLHEPGAPEPTPWQPPEAWNGKLAYTFGGACGVGYWQGTSTGGVENDLLLSRGYAVASATFNVFAQNCNDVTSAETAMMVKEHVIETLGPVEYTIGSGGSAGTMQQLLLSNNYPGILDGVLGEIGYPDERTTTVTGHDCRGLLTYWSSDAGSGWTDAEKVAVTGHALAGTCTGFTYFDGVDDPNRGCASAIPVEDRWSEANPTGLRCTISDMVKNVYGTDEEGRGLRVEPDNVGIQYGWDAVQNGEITVEQFVSLNEGVGGVTVDGERTAERSEASVEAIERAFATGRVNMMTGGLAYIPVIEIRNYTDTTGDFHERYRSAIIRERMLGAYGNADTHVSWTGSNDWGNTEQMRAAALDQLEAWLDAIMAAGGPGDRQRTIDARPDGLTDGCFDASMNFISEVVDYDDPTTACNQLYPYHSQPRAEAGMPLTADVLKCQLTDPVRADYPEMTDEQWDRLLAVFPTGVCDWSKPSQGYTELVGTWLDFGETEQVALAGPTIEGDAVVGETLTASADAADASLTYQWIADGHLIDGATDDTYTLTEDDSGTAITVRVTASAAGLVSRTTVSDATPRIALTSVPTISGTPSVGERLTAEVGEWTAGTEFSYRWFADGRELRGETGATLRVRLQHLHAKITVEVTGTLDGHRTVTLTSDPTLKTALATRGAVVGLPWAGTSAIAVPGLWTSGTTFTYQWLRDGAPIEGATKKIYRLTTADRGHEITVEVTGSKSGYPTLIRSSLNDLRVL